MSKTSIFQIIKTKDNKTKQAVTEYVALGELDRTITTKEDRIAWEQLWKEFVASEKWLYAIVFIREYGI